MLYKLMLIATALQLVAITETANRLFKLEFHSYTCSNITEPINNFGCALRKLGSGRYIFNSNVTFSRNVDDLQVRIWFDLQPTKGQKAMRFFDWRFNACEALSHPLGNQMLMLLANEMKRTSNLPRSCPLKGNVQYKAENFSITGADIPAYAPMSNFTYIFQAYLRNKLLVDLKVTGAIVPK